jgi:LPXTG-motif cell wall-anchored protein
MKKMRKIFAVLLTLAMVLAMSIPTFAAEKNNTITISGKGLDAEGAEAYYGQIIKEDRQSTLGWKFATDATTTGKFVDAWNKASKSATSLDANGVIQALINLGVIESPENKNVEAGKINSLSGSANLSAALAAVTNAATNSLDLKTGAVVEKGLYIVTAHSAGYTYLPMAAYMNTAGDNVAIVAKGAKDQLNKTVAESGKSVAPGDEVNYTIDEEYLYFAPNTNPKTFTITDKLTNGKFKAGSVKVVLKDTIDAENSNVLEAGKDYGINGYADGTELNLDFGSYYNSANVGKIVEVTYTAIAGEVTTDAPLYNSAHSSNGTGKIVEVKPVSFKVIKKDDKEEKYLPDAKFQIYKKAANGDDGAVKLNLNKKVGKETVYETVYGIPVGNPIETDNKGEASVNNLDAQETYYVKETKAPNGYSLNEDAFELTGAEEETATETTREDNGVKYIVKTYNYTNFNAITVTDTKLSALPSTGGIGTTIFTIAGCLIMVTAAGLFFASRKRTNK